MRHRVFIAINLPEDIKQKLAEYQYKWPELPARWTKKENLHITQEFLGYLTDEEILKTGQRLREEASRQEPHSVTLNKIIYGPPEKPPSSKSSSNSFRRSPSFPIKSWAPRMVWAVGDPYHITLARLKQLEFRKLDPEERPQINEDINLTFEINSIEVMESQLKRTGSEYVVLESFPLGSNI